MPHVVLRSDGRIKTAYFATPEEAARYVGKLTLDDFADSADWPPECSNLAVIDKEKIEEKDVIRLVAPALLKAARALCEGTDNEEYVRGQAEVIIDFTPGLSMDHKEVLMRYLVRPPAPPRRDPRRPTTGPWAGY